MSEKKIAKKGPYKVKVEPDKTYAYCACGHSKKQPFCDGSHKGTDLSPAIIVFKEAQEVAFCGCKQNKKGCFCDGSHEKLLEKK